VLPYLIDQTIESGALAAQLVGVAPLLRESPELTALMAQMGTRIRGINDETLRAVQAILRVAAERGYTHYQIANGVEADGYRGIRAVVEETYRGRADTIARTELGTASQRAAHDRYREANVVEVRILDGIDCVMAGTPFSGAPLGMVRAWFSGYGVRLEYRDTTTSLMNSVTVGPHHPVLTAHGWREAMTLREGDDLIHSAGLEDAIAATEPHLEQVPSVEDVFEALRRATGSVFRARGGDEFHGDAGSLEGKVEVVGPARRLLIEANPACTQGVGEFYLMGPDPAPAFVSCTSGALEFRRGLWAPSSRCVCIDEQRPAGTVIGDGPLVGSSARDRAEAPPLDRGPASLAPSRRPPRVEANMGAESRGTVVTRPETDAAHLTGRLSGRALVRLTHVAPVPYDGWVYDAYTRSGTFAAGAIVLRNCGWLSHDDPDLAHNSVRSLRDAAQHPLAHPNCLRVTVPIVGRR